MMCEAGSVHPHRLGPKGYTKNGARLPKTDDGNPSHQHFEWVQEDSFPDASNSSDVRLNLRFVVETGTTRPYGTIRNLIRSHARRGRNKQSRAVGPGPVLLNEDEEDEMPDKFSKHGDSRMSTQYKQKAQNTQVIRAPGNNAFNAISILPAGERGHALALLNHYEKVFRHCYTPAHPREKWLPFAISDPALLSATLFSAAISLCLLRGKRTSPDMVYHLGETIRLTNKALSDPKRIVTNANICAVACLTLFESVSGTPASVKIHIDGLETMVKSRGGLPGLGRAELTRNLTTWVDSCASIVLETKPRFEPFDFVDAETLDRRHYSPLAIRYRAKLFNLTGLQDLSAETVDIYWDLRGLTALKDVASCHPDQNVEMISYGTTLEYLERRVVRMVQQEALASPNITFAIYRAFGHAVLIHIYMFMRDFPRGLPIFHHLSSRVRKSLECVDIETIYIQYPEMMLWILILGGFGGIGTPDRGWFANLLAKVCSLSGLRGGNEIAFTLAEFLWSELYRGPFTMGFWNDVAIAQGVEGGYEVGQLTDHVSAAPFNAPPEITE